VVNARRPETHELRQTIRHVAVEEHGGVVRE